VRTRPSSFVNQKPLLSLAVLAVLLSIGHTGPLFRAHEPVVEQGTRLS